MRRTTDDIRDCADGSAFSMRIVRIPDIVEGFELDVLLLAAHILDPAHVDVLYHLAAVAVDGERPA